MNPDERHLSERDRTVLDIEAGWWSAEVSKAELVARRLDMSLTRFHEILDALVDDPAAEAYDPLLVRRLRRHRERRRSTRRTLPPVETSS